MYDEVVQIGHLLDEEERKKKLEVSLQQMPTPYYLLSKKIFTFLHEFTQFSELNKMGVKNLGLIWGPVFLRPDVTTLSSFSDVSAYHKIAECLVEDPNRFFFQNRKNSNNGKTTIPPNFSLMTYSYLKKSSETSHHEQNPNKPAEKSNPINLGKKRHTRTLSSCTLPLPEMSPPSSLDTDSLLSRKTRETPRAPFRPTVPPKGSKPQLRLSPNIQLSASVRVRTQTSVKSARELFEKMPQNAPDIGPKKQPAQRPAKPFPSPQHAPMISLKGTNPPPPIITLILYKTKVARILFEKPTTLDLLLPVLCPILGNLQITNEAKKQKAKPTHCSYILYSF